MEGFKRKKVFKYCLKSMKTKLEERGAKGYERKSLSKHFMFEEKM
jgi:hypothetical protein